jgi:hypothetical protein
VFTTLTLYSKPDMSAISLLQAVMGRFPSEVVYSLPEYSYLDHDFWYNRRGVGATDWIPVGKARKTLDAKDG